MAINRDLDLVFVIDDGPAMAGWQATLAMQLPSLMATAQCAPNGVAAGLHVAVVSSDLGLGAAANASVPGCTAAGDGGNLRSQPEGMCTDTTLDSGATFISDIGSTHNFTAPDEGTESGATKVFQCIAELGDGGCGFGQPLAALDRALGADGRPPPPANAGFLRPDAYLGIVFISNQDDCSAPAGTTLFSLRDPAENDLSDPQGPLTHYRCNHAGHVCRDANGNPVSPPLAPPAGATSVDGVPTLPLADCASNDADGALTPVAKLVADIRSLKSDPDHQILVSGVVGPPTPYAVEWVPEVGGTTAGEAWPRVAPSCGSRAADGSGAYGEPSVRLAQFIEAFPNYVLGSVCDPDYAELLKATICNQLEDFITPPCLSGNIQTKTDAEGRSYPDCVVTEHLTSADGSRHDYPLPACAATTPGAPCWSLGAVGTGNCPADEGPFSVANEPVGSDPAHYAASASVSCQLTPPADAGVCPG